MSCGLQRDCASANTGRMSSGVATYRIRSRQLFRIQKFGRDRTAGTAGTICGREKAVTCCMWRSAANYSLEATKINAQRALSSGGKTRKRPCRCDEKKNHAIKDQHKTAGRGFFLAGAG